MPQQNESDPTKARAVLDAVMKGETTVFVCGPSTAACKCGCNSGGPCEHKWDGPWREEKTPSGATIGTATCSRCGMDAFEHDQWIDR